MDHENRWIRRKIAGEKWQQSLMEQMNDASTAILIASSIMSNPDNVSTGRKEILKEVINKDYRFNSINTNQFFSISGSS